MKKPGHSGFPVLVLALLMGLSTSSFSRASAQTVQDFQNPGTPYVPSQTGTANPPTVMAGGPTGGNFIRLISATDTPGTNSIAFDRSDPGAYTQIVADFDFRMNPGTGQGQGMGFALLSTAAYNKTGALAGPAEEPNLTGSLGIGFDIHQDAGDVSGNEVSVHFNNGVLQQVDAGAIPLAGNQWIHAHVVLRPGGGFSDVSVILTPSSTGTPVTLISNFPVPGFAPYEGRAYFAARTTSTDTADHDLANVQLQFTADPSVLGRWGGVLALPIVPIHSHLLSTGKVLSWDRAATGSDTIPRLIDVATLDVPPGNVNVSLASDPGFELFCSGHTLMADGRVFVAGGTINDQNLLGLDTAFIYDPLANTWTRLPDMGTGGRWYPSVELLTNGDAVVLSGTMTPTAGFNQTIQVMQFGTGTWRTLTGAARGMTFYPMLHLAPNGQVFYAGPDTTSSFLDTSGVGAWTYTSPSNVGLRDYGCSVLYGTGKIINLGGGNFNPPDPNLGTPTNTAEVIDITASVPTWRLVAPMSYARRQCNALLLPDGSILVTGGTSGPGFNDQPGSVLAAELWDPVAESWQVLAGMAVGRTYHSETVLLPDGRVLSQGGGHGGNGIDTFNAEVYSPPYLFKGPRPVVTAAPTSLIFGQAYSVQSPDAASVTSVTLIGASSVTHSTNFHQRILRPTWSAGSGSISFTAPSDPNLCPPGPYLLFLLNASGVPSVGQWMDIHVNLPPVARVGPNFTAAATGPSGAMVTLDGTASTDP
ncbi:MAG TPA: galactose oxidase-like domain-containing protein, partial [Planctomycetota bacterium]|nr:galactose oxidase-like domain-containing protein [Planctomycetota bacterium]